MTADTGVHSGSPRSLQTCHLPCCWMKATAASPFAPTQTAPQLQQAGRPFKSKVSWGQLPRRCACCSQESGKEQPSLSTSSTFICLFHAFVCRGRCMRHAAHYVPGSRAMMPRLWCAGKYRAARPAILSKSYPSWQGKLNATGTSHFSLTSGDASEIQFRQRGTVDFTA